MAAQGVTSLNVQTLGEYPGVTSVATGDGIIAIQFENATCLESMVRHLLNDAFDMTRDGNFEDFALIHGTHGLPMPCDWLGFRSGENGGTIWLKSHVPEESILGDVYSWDSTNWITERGHGFMLSRDEYSDVWLDFNSGRTIVSLKQGARARSPFGPNRT